MISVKIYLDRASYDWWMLQARDHGSSLSNFLRLIPRFVTPEEDAVLQRLRAARRKGQTDPEALK